MINIIDEIEIQLKTKRFDNDIVATLSMPEHKFKKISDKLNDILLIVYNEHKKQGFMMKDIILELSPYFDMDYLTNKILNDKIKNIIKKEYTKNISLFLSKNKRKTIK